MSCSIVVEEGPGGHDTWRIDLCSIAHDLYGFVMVSRSNVRFPDYMSNLTSEHNKSPSPRRDHRGESHSHALGAFGHATHYAFNMSINMREGVAGNANSNTCVVQGQVEPRSIAPQVIAKLHVVVTEQPTRLKQGRVVDHEVDRVVSPLSYGTRMCVCVLRQMTPTAPNTKRNTHIDQSRHGAVDPGASYHMSLRARLQSKQQRR